MTISTDSIGFLQKRSNPEFFKRAYGKNSYAMNVKNYDLKMRDM
jgi:hypothetical protein